MQPSRPSQHASVSRPEWRWGYVDVHASLKRSDDDAHLGPLRGSGACRGRIASGRRRPQRREQGLALVLVLTVVAILSVFVADLHEHTTSGFSVAVAQRDRLKAEYVARSGLNLTRLLIAKEPQIRKLVAPMYKGLMGSNPPQINVWQFADDILGPFFNRQNPAKDAQAEAPAFGPGIDLSATEGLEPIDGQFEIRSVVENSKININNPLFRDKKDAQRSVAMQLYGLMGGFSPSNPYEALFSKPDPDGNYTTPSDIVSSVIDWWDFDQERTNFDPATTQISMGGAEDDIYQHLDDPYRIKNAPFDSLEELRLVRGIGDDFWATFIEPEPNDPNSRQVTIYASGSVNVNEATPQVLLARLCSFLVEQAPPLCVNLEEQQRFVGFLGLIRSFTQNVALFGTPEDFLKFVQGKGMIFNAMGGGGQDGDQASGQQSPASGGGMAAMFGAQPFTPIANIPKKKRGEILKSFITAASILTLQSTATVGRSQVRIESVMNFHDRWSPPQPNAGTMPKLGIFHHYRIE